MCEADEDCKDKDVTVPTTPLGKLYQHIDQNEWLFDYIEIEESAVGVWWPKVILRQGISDKLKEEALLPFSKENFEKIVWNRDSFDNFVKDLKSNNDIITSTSFNELGYEKIQIGFTRKSQLHSWLLRETPNNRFDPKRWVYGLTHNEEMVFNWILRGINNVSSHRRSFCCQILLQIDEIEGYDFITKLEGLNQHSTVREMIPDIDYCYHFDAGNNGGYNPIKLNNVLSQIGYTILTTQKASQSETIDNFVRHYSTMRWSITW